MFGSCARCLLSGTDGAWRHLNTGYDGFVLPTSARMVYKIPTWYSALVHYLIDSYSRNSKSVFVGLF